MRELHLVPDLQQRLSRALIGSVILSAHVIVLYGAVTFGPKIALHNAIEPVTAYFIQAPERRSEWQPPAVRPEIPALDLPVPLAPPIEHQVTEPTETRAITARPLVQPAALVARNDGPPKLISSVEYVREPTPRYPPQSRRLREQGMVVLRVLIDEKGQACDIAIESSSGHTRLDMAAKDAVARAEFRPYVEDGAPRRALVLIPIEFSLNHGSV